MVADTAGGVVAGGDAAGDEAAGGDAAGGGAADGDAAGGNAAGGDAATASDFCARSNSFEPVTVRRQVRGERDTLTSRCCNIVTSTT